MSGTTNKAPNIFKYLFYNAVFIPECRVNAVLDDINAKTIPILEKKKAFKYYVNLVFLGAELLYESLCLYVCLSSVCMYVCMYVCHTFFLSKPYILYTTYTFYRYAY